MRKRVTTTAWSRKLWFHIFLAILKDLADIQVVVASHTVLKQGYFLAKLMIRKYLRVHRVVDGEFTKLRANSAYDCSRIFLFDSHHYFALLLPFHCLQLLLQENGTRLLKKNGIRDSNYRYWEQRFSPRIWWDLADMSWWPGSLDCEFFHSTSSGVRFYWFFWLAIYHQFWSVWQAQKITDVATWTKLQYSILYWDKNTDFQVSVFNILQWLIFIELVKLLARKLSMKTSALRQERRLTRLKKLHNKK